MLVANRVITPLQDQASQNKAKYYFNLTRHFPVSKDDEILWAAPWFLTVDAATWRRNAEKNGAADLRCSAILDEVDEELLLVVAAVSCPHGRKWPRAKGQVIDAESGAIFLIWNK